jgi:hypothetical protein
MRGTAPFFQRRLELQVPLTVNEWLKAQQLDEMYWLYVVWGLMETGGEPVCVQDPAHRLEYAAREVRVLSGYEVPAEAVERAARIRQ